MMLNSERGAGTMLLMAFLLPIMGVMISLGLELTNYFQTMESMQSVADELALHSERFLPNQARAEAAARALFATRRSQLQEDLELSLPKLVFSGSSVQVGLSGEVPIFGLGLINLIAGSSDSTTIPVEVFSEIRSQSVDLVLVLDLWSQPILAAAPIGADGDIPENCIEHPAVSMLKTVVPVTERIARNAVSRAQILVTPYQGLNFSVFPLEALSNPASYEEPEQCKGVAGVSDMGLAGFLEKQLEDGAIEGERPNLEDFGDAVQFSFSEGNAAITRLLDPIKRSVLYLPMFGRVPDAPSVEQMQASLLAGFDALLKMAQRTKSRIYATALLPVTDVGLPSVIRGSSSDAALQIRLLDVPSDEQGRAQLTTLLTSSLHAGIIAK